ncbi:MAG: DUF5615 family PIN-like protein [Phycisphaerae bacterium]|nr:DUF5615 family PIN-like protein [Saprospiraceae bacterium]
MTFIDLQFLTDENIDRELVVFLRSLGLDVFDIKEEELFRLPDEEILFLSVKHRRVVISQDSDFGTLIFRDGHPLHGVIYLRPGHESPSFHLQTLSAILDAGLEISIPFIMTAENNGESVRIRLRNL